MNKEYLSDKEEKAFIKELTKKIINPTIDNVIALADKYNVDRDNAIESFSGIFNAMTKFCTFQNWKGGDTK